MSHDVIAELRRRLVGFPGIERLERRPPERTRDDQVARATLSTDGGERRDRGDDEHLRNLPDGAGCTEIWEHLSERHAEDGGAAEPGAVECRADD